MAALHARYPADDDVATLYAASLMEVTPWDYWAKDRRPKQTGTITALSVRESVIAPNPRHAGALQYYIHIVEAVHPERGERAADLAEWEARGSKCVPTDRHLSPLPVGTMRDFGSRQAH
jgi:hypothetical protein